MGDEVRVTVIATGFDSQPAASRACRAAPAAPARGPAATSALDDRDRSALEISDDEIDIPPFLRERPYLSGRQPPGPTSGCVSA